MSPTSRSRVAVRAAQVIGTAVLFALAETFGRLFPAEPGVFVLFPATAVAIVATMWCGVWGALGVFLGSISSEGLKVPDAELFIGGVIAASEGLIPWLVFRARKTLSVDLRDFRSLAAFLLFGAVLNTAVNAIAGNLFILHHNTPATYWRGVFIWWISDFSAAILLATPALAFGGQLVRRRSGRSEQPRTVANALQIVTVVTILGFAGAVAIRAWLQHRVEGDRLAQQENWGRLQTTLASLHHGILSTAFVDPASPSFSSRNSLITQTRRSISLELIPLLRASGPPLSGHVQPLQERADGLYRAWDETAANPANQSQLSHRAHELAGEIVALRDEVDRLNVLAWNDYARQRARMITAASILDAIVLVILLLSFTTILLNISRPFQQIRDGISALRDGRPFERSDVSSPYLEFQSIADTLGQTSRELSQREEELRRETERAVAASRHKTDFLAKMSHELRTPLNSIIGFSELLIEQEATIATPKRLAFLDNVMNSAQHLLKLINDLLDISKIESGKMNLHIQLIDVRMAIANTVASTTPLFHRKRQRIEVDVPPQPLMIEGDLGRLEQVLLNLLSNANKFAPEGDHVSIKARNTGATCVIDVQDHGIGIPPESQSRIFHEFEQIETSGGEHSTGTGLGLALARRFVEAHGGSITVESRVGAGSTFRVTLPVSRAGLVHEQSVSL